MSFKKIAVASAAAAALVVAMAGCSSASSDSASGGDSANKDIKICVYTHGDGGTFWSVAQAGAEAAGADLGVTVDYQGSSNDAAKEAQTIEAGVSGGCQGIAASAPDPDAIKDALATAEAAGIPVITMNSGSAVFEDLGAYTHVGQDEVIAGEGAGKKFNEIGATKVLCPIQEAANVGLTDRCAGVKNTFKGEVVELNVDGALADPTGAQAKIKAALDADPSIDGIIALNADVATGSALPAVQASGRDIQIGTFDMSSDALDSIEAGDIAFAIDQQQYAQGYMSVVLLYLAIVNGNELGGGMPIYTGPGFVTADNVKVVKEYVAGGTR